MKHSEESSDARERLLDAAERLFAQRGFSSVTLRDIAAAIGIHHTTVYHHVPGGKEQLFIDVLERGLQRHRHGLTQAIGRTSSDLREGLRAAADWLLSQPPMDLVRLVNSDMPSIDPLQAARLSQLTYESMLFPIQTLLASAQKRGQLEHQDLALVAGIFIGIIESLYATPEIVKKSRKSMAYEAIDILLNGLRPRSASDQTR